MSGPAYQSHAAGAGDGDFSPADDLTKQALRALMVALS
jgi:hypothetical protein